MCIRDSGVSLRVRQGEIVGIAGLMGAGRTELAMSVFGRSYGQRISGEVLMHGKAVDVSTVRKAIDHGIAYVTEDRKGLGLVLEEEIRKNVSLANLDAVADGLVIDPGREFQVANEYRKALNIRCAGIEQPVVNLSGGNQQKVVLSKWLFTQPELLILDEPTRGIDVGAKRDIYFLVQRLAREGLAVIVISSELMELIGLCHRVAVMRAGRLVATLDADHLSEEALIAHATGAH